MEQLLDLEIVDSIREVGDFRDNDDFAKELYQLFTEQAGKSTAELLAAVERGDLPQARYYAHRLKGSAGNIGARAVAERAAAIEAAARGGSDAEFLMTTARELEPILKASLAALSERLLAGAPGPAPLA